MQEGAPSGQPEASESTERAAGQALRYGSGTRRKRRMWSALPGSPRCKMCNGPLGGPLGPLMRAMGKGPWPANAKYCRWCFRALYTQRAGAEIDCSLLFADVRGSTALAETMPARDFRALMDRFYEMAVKVLTDHDAIVDKFVGDEVVAIFIPALTAGRHAHEAIDAGRDLLLATGNATDSPWVPIGAGVTSGVAYVGAVGTAEHVEFTALGDPVNVAARLASAAGAGELLVSDGAARAADLSGSGLERRHLELKGKSEATDVLVLTAR